MPGDETTAPQNENTDSAERERSTVDDVFERFKKYLDEKVESVSSGLASQTTTETKKLSRVAEAEKLKFSGNKDQFLFNSELSGTLDEVSHFLDADNTEKAGEKVVELKKTLQRRQKVIKLADKSEAGWLAVKEYQTEELASDSEDEKRIRKAQERALKIKKQNAAKKPDRDRSSSSGASRPHAGDDRMLFRAAPSSGTKIEWYYIGGPALAVIFVILAIVAWYIRKRRTAAKANVTSRRDEEQGHEMEEVNQDVDQWEISIGRITLREVIGTGSFGAVWRATLSQTDGRPGKQIVAAKCFTPTSGKDGRKALMREIELGKLLGVNPQENVVTFIGCVTTQIHPVLITEYMAYGDLLGYLRKSRGIHDKYHIGENAAAFELQTYDLVLFAKQIAAGMVFLGSHGIIHRDLAARNVLLDRNFICKVTDFGLAYQNFKYGHGQAKKGCMPIKWTAPEILLGNPASLCYQSDVYDLMLRCWHHNPDFRPPFEFLRQKMVSYIEKKMYLELLDMSEYDAAKYSKVEDIPVEGKRRRGSGKKPVPPPRKKKCASVHN